MKPVDESERPSDCPVIPSTDNDVCQECFHSMECIEFQNAKIMCLQAEQIENHKRNMEEQKKNQQKEIEKPVEQHPPYQHTQPKKLTDEEAIGRFLMDYEKFRALVIVKLGITQSNDAMASLFLAFNFNLHLYYYKDLPEAVGYVTR